jgi:hypothetical protein
MHHDRDVGSFPSIPEFTYPIPLQNSIPRDFSPAVRRDRNGSSAGSPPPRDDHVSHLLLSFVTLNLMYWQVREVPIGSSGEVRFDSHFEVFILFLGDMRAH